jgi:cytochrome c6
MISNLAWLRTAFPRSGIALAVALTVAAGSACAADVRRGAALYATHCASCHGANGVPVMAGSPNFRRLDTLMRPDAQLMTAIRNGKGAMPAYFGILRERELQDVVVFLRTLN